MRIFKNESIFNQETQDWEEYYSIDSEQVSVDVYSEQVEIEELATEDDNIENVIPCDCVFCQHQRELERQDEVQEQEEIQPSCDGNCAECDSEDREEDYPDCECEECKAERKVDLLAEAVSNILEGVCCPQCLFELLENVYDIAHLEGFDEGVQTIKDEIHEFIGG